MNQPNQEQRHTPKVSIGMPVFNGDKFIREALDSLLAQTFTDFELIISDNASTDRTEAICREYAARDPRVRYVPQSENRGATANFQFVLDEAVGEYFMWAATDDTRHQEFLRLALTVFESDNDCGLVFCDYRTVIHETGSSSRADVATLNSGKPRTRYLMRLLGPCSSLIYGLHKTSILRQFPLGNYDFADVHLTHWYAIHSIVKIIPMPLYTAGVKGRLTSDKKRIPFSLTGAKIDASRFLKEEKKMLYRSLSFVEATLLYMLLRYLCFKNVRVHNAIIKREE